MGGFYSSPRFVCANYYRLQPEEEQELGDSHACVCEGQSFGAAAMKGLCSGVGGRGVVEGCRRR